MPKAKRKTRGVNQRNSPTRPSRPGSTRVGSPVEAGPSHINISPTPGTSSDHHDWPNGFTAGHSYFKLYKLLERLKDMPTKSTDEKNLVREVINRTDTCLLPMVKLVRRDANDVKAAFGNSKQRIYEVINDIKKLERNINKFKKANFTGQFVAILESKASTKTTQMQRHERDIRDSEQAIQTLSDAIEQLEENIRESDLLAKEQDAKANSTNEEKYTYMNRGFTAAGTAAATLAAIAFGPLTAVVGTSALLTTAAGCASVSSWQLYNAIECHKAVNIHRADADRQRQTKSERKDDLKIEINRKETMIAEVKRLCHEIETIRAEIRALEAVSGHLNDINIVLQDFLTISELVTLEKEDGDVTVRDRPDLDTLREKWKELQRVLIEQ